jgi:SAM-dependent methyltransferase
MESNTVREYYNDFLRSRMADYRLYGNLRLNRAAERILPFVGTHSNVLDIGCGIGIVTSKIAARANRGHVWGIDLSRENIWYATRTVRNANLTFLEADVVVDFEAIRKKLPAKVDVVTMLGVIEHIPTEARPDLLVKIRALCNDGCGDGSYLPKRAIPRVPPRTQSKRIRSRRDSTGRLGGALISAAVLRGSAAFALMLGMLGRTVGWPMPSGGAKMISEALLQHLRALGGKIQTGVFVTSLRLLPRSRVVLLDVTPRQLIRIAGEKLPVRIDEHLNASGTVQVFLRLIMLWMGRFRGYMRFANRLEQFT